ncbi:MAG: S-layer homology domain-containing protein [Clostridia bacterium]|nr:S-layer homology domain-containing protein [Clostridia bacterium]
MTTGVQKELISHIRDYDYETVCGAVDEVFPIEYEIPRKNTGSLKDQGGVGACVAEVIAQIAENWYSKQLGEPTEMSEGFIYGGLRKENETSEGMLVSRAMQYWTSIGTLPKKYFDVLKEMPEIKEIVLKFPDFYELASKYKITGYVTMNYSEEKKDAAIKSALMKYGYGLVAVSNDYFRGGAHCIQLVGWNDKTGKYKFKNSWGEGYGDKGFAEIPKDEINVVYLPLFEEIKLPFTDVPETAWYYEDVKKIYFSGQMKGTSDTTFEPDRPLTRAEAAALFNRTNRATDQRFDILNKVIEEKIK